MMLITNMREHGTFVRCFSKRDDLFPEQPKIFNFTSFFVCSNILSRAYVPDDDMETMKIIFTKWIRSVTRVGRSQGSRRKVAVRC